MADKQAKASAADEERDPPPPQAPQDPVTITIGDGPALPLSDGAARSNTRAAANSVPAGLLMKVNTNIGRISSIRALSDRIVEAGEAVTLACAEQWRAECQELYETFGREHSIIESSCPAVLTQHEYFTRGAAAAAFQHYSSTMQRITQIIEKLTPDTQNNSSTSSSQGANHHGNRLPEIQLPSFDGSYADWQGFKELFTSMVIEDSRLSQVEKLHYLRTSVKGRPAALIQGYPLSGDSLNLAWAALVERFENKKFVLAQHFESLRRIRVAQVNQPASLNQVVSEHSRLRKLIVAMGTPQQILDSVFVDSLLQLVDRHTREAWETSATSKMDLPAIVDLEEFLVSRVQALEMIHGTGGSQQGSTQPQNKKSSKPHSACTSQVQETTQKDVQPKKDSQIKPPITDFTQRSSYACDSCGDKHFIAMCPQFAAMSVEQRHKLVVDKRLCFNCLGRHAASRCQNRKRCVECGSVHHTMIHGAPGLRTVARGSAPAEKAQPR